MPTWSKRSQGFSNSAFSSRPCPLISHGFGERRVLKTRRCNLSILCWTQSAQSTAATGIRKALQEGRGYVSVADWIVGRAH
jgi:hypothetical protein